MNSLDRLFFSQRFVLDQMFRQWCEEQSEIVPAVVPMNVVAWLDRNGLIDRKAVKKFLEDNG